MGTFRRGVGVFELLELEDAVKWRRNFLTFDLESAIMLGRSQYDLGMSAVVDSTEDAVYVAFIPSQVGNSASFHSEVILRRFPHKVIPPSEVRLASSSESSGFRTLSRNLFSSPEYVSYRELRALAEVTVMEETRLEIKLAEVGLGDMMVLELDSTFLDMRNPSTPKGGGPFSFQHNEEMQYYAPYRKYLPSNFVKLLCVWDQLRIPHEEREQVFRGELLAIGFDVDPNLMRARMLDESQAILIASLTDFAVQGSPALP
ncbi:hypothetical protein DFJ58DRAFT_739425 [Suillus subalutaceus]|uniref:uncharacterized protein n=1 Tax=Suillus subalutaceus TaxID=48586 RepID=UPI001B86CA6F|nr:uncharacterized protein DFJ58DRAFT_739425 [Suillus subalutaceus]KAG1819396.1 hypothetical protein DFJ58DRAFT_739425 [Suillus subalutaceus]